MTFWEIFIACLTGAGAMTAALATIGLIAWGLLYAVGFLFAWIQDALEDRARR